MTARRTWLALVVLTAVAWLAPGTVEAQRGGPQANVTPTPADVLFSSPNEVDFNTGWVEHLGGVSLLVEPRNKNRPNWQLFVQASAADMGGYGKPVQDIQVRVEGSSAWTSLSTTALLVGEGTGSTTVTLYYRLLLDWAVDAPGSYSVPLEYSATSF